MLWVVIGFLGVALLLYCILGGADFGAGALEFFVPAKNRKRHEELVNRAMGPVWEANHMWLIILIVILFNAFPRVYTQYSIYFHVPLTLMLVGIVFRGCAFTFRNYDVIKDDTHRYYTFAFGLSSLLTPLMFGMIIGGMLSGVDPHAAGYYQKYMAPWFNFFSCSIGIFVLSMFVYLASVYLIGESDDPSVRRYYFRYAQKTSIAMLMAGSLVFLLAQISGHPFFRMFFTNPASITCFVAVTILTVIFWQGMLHGRFTEWTIRLIAGSQVALVLLAWLAVIYPNVLFYRDGTKLSLLAAAAPPATITVLAWALMIGALSFLPVFYYLIQVFKIQPSLSE